MKIENRVSVSLPQISFVIFVLSAACLKSVCVPLFVRECVFVCACLGGGGTGDSKTLTSCTPPFSLSLSLSPSPWSLAGPRYHGNAHIAAGWLKRGALVEKESMRGAGARGRERSLQREGRAGENWSSNSLPPPKRKKKNLNPTPPTILSLASPRLGSRRASTLLSSLNTLDPNFRLHLLFILLLLHRRQHRSLTPSYTLTHTHTHLRTCTELRQQEHTISIAHSDILHHSITFRWYNAIQ